MHGHKLHTTWKGPTLLCCGRACRMTPRCVFNLSAHKQAQTANYFKCQTQCFVYKVDYYFTISMATETALHKPAYLCFWAISVYTHLHNSVHIQDEGSTGPTANLKGAYVLLSNFYCIFFKYWAKKINKLCTWCINQTHFNQMKQYVALGKIKNGLAKWSRIFF